MAASTVSALRVKIFADGANLTSIKALAQNPVVRGFTTNPTLMRLAGVPDYKVFAHQVLEVIPHRPVSFEVFADDLAGMKGQAFEIASWGNNVNVKIPVTNTKGGSTASLVGELARGGVVCNVTAVFTLEQVAAILQALPTDAPAIISIFAGRIADSGLDPVPLMREAVTLAARSHPRVEFIWASPRELLNILQADEVGCQIITVTEDVLKKLPLIGKDLAQYSLETVQMFYRDATAAGYSIGNTAKE